MDGQWPAAIVLLALGTLVSVLNWTALFMTLRTGRNHSPVPLFGAGCLGLGALLLPSLQPFAWLAVFLDFGTLALLLALPWIAHGAWVMSRFNVLEEYVGQRGITSVRLRLFRRRIFTLYWTIQRPPGECGILGTGNSGTWRQEAETLVLQFGDDRAVFTKLSVDGKPGWIESVAFSQRNPTPELSLEGMEFILKLKR